ncbi:EamA family transporter RarD [Zafaria sp. J156]|uniref:EamA family transporter RarD n=1 Tax=Zafaria sp. J156 TaxID=3116490 RepID=UPI002E7845A6|nr:EamA family transporter RarD [Zafaria sp. J156]MEE1621240.1 EamA family transporter RarD [Zafaria sp. J156]
MPSPLPASATPSPGTAAPASSSPGSPRGTGGDAAAERSAGLLFGLGAYGLWGLLPLYFLTIATASPAEIVANRVLWSLVFCALLLTLTRAWADLGVLLRDKASMLRLSAAAVLIAVNWLTYTFAVLGGHAVEASLGYFITPLVSTALGVVLLKERLNRLQWTAMGFGLAAVLVLTFAYGSVPVIALVLAFSFGLYGFVKNRVGRTASAVTGLTVETLVLTLPALGFMAFLLAQGGATLVSTGPAHFWLMAASGIITAVPLLFFGAAARRLPLTLIGTLQYLAPVLQFILALTVFGEHMPLERWIGFGLVWVAIVLLTADLARRAGSGRAERRAARKLAAPAPQA